MFLTPSEIRLMHRDWTTLLKSSEATPIRFLMKLSAAAEDVDPVYHVHDEEQDDFSFTGKAIQYFVKPMDEALLKFGIVEAGDCIFYTSIEYDTSSGIPGTLEIQAPIGDSAVTWVPVPRERKEFFNYLITRLGSSQLSQVIPCKLKK